MHVIYFFYIFLNNVYVWSSCDFSVRISTWDLFQSGGEEQEDHGWNKQCIWELFSVQFKLVILHITFYRNTTLGVCPHLSQTLAQLIIWTCRYIMYCPSPIQHKNMPGLYHSLLIERFSSQNLMWVRFLKVLSINSFVLGMSLYFKGFKKMCLKYDWSTGLKYVNVCKYTIEEV